MNNAQLQRTLRLLRKTGDRGIVLDPGSDEVFVLMDADSYEEMLLGESESNDGGSGIDDYVLDDLLEIEERGSDSKEKPDFSESEPKNDHKPVKPKSPLNFSEDWAAEKNPILSEESLSDVPHEEEEEEKFYLEPVE